MTWQDLYNRLTTAGKIAMLFGVLVTVGGICLGNTTIITSGCLPLFLAAYIMAFALAKGF